MARRTNEFSIVVVPDSLEVTRHGSLSGIIYYTVGAKSFPEAGWYDFPLWVLTSWLAFIKRSRARRVPRAEIPFYDGPFVCRLANVGDDAWKMNLDCNGIKMSTEAELELPRDKIVRAVNAAVRMVLSACAALHLESDEITALRNKYSAIRESDG